MAINYTSYPAWNDPFNPWVRFNTLSLSAAEVSLRTFTLTSFNPVGGGIAARYQDNAGAYYLDYDADGSVWGNGVGWTLYDTAVEETLYSRDVNTPNRATPSKVVGVVDGWNVGSLGTNQLTLYINPTRPPTQWEKRRKRILGYR